MKLTGRSWPWLCALALLPIVWLWPCVIGGNTFVPIDPVVFPPASLALEQQELDAARQGADFDVTEVQAWLLPEMKIVQEEVARGHWPSWNPHARTGAPLHEAGAHGVFYPPHWLWLFGGDPASRTVWLSWISLALAGVFSFLLLHEFGMARAAAAFGAATFQLSGTMMSNGYYWTRLPALAWLPALLLALHYYGEGERAPKKMLVAVAVSFAMPWYAGFPPYAMAVSLLGVWFTLRMLLVRLGTEGSAAARRLLKRFLIAFGIGALLTMPQVLPSFWFFAFEGARASAQGISMASGARFELYGLLGYLVPDAYGHQHQITELPAQNNPLCYLWGNLTDADGNAAEPRLNHTEYSIFFGTIGFVLAAYASLRGKRHLRWTLILTFAGMLGLALFLPLFRLAYYLPFLGNVQPMRWLAPATLFLAWLAAMGFDRLMHVGRESLVRVAIVTLGLAVLTWWLTSWPASWHAADPDWPARPIGERFGIPVPDVHEHFHQGTAAGFDRYAVACEQFAAAGSQAALWLCLGGLVIAAIAWLHRTRARPWLVGLLALLSLAQLSMRGVTLLGGQPLPKGTDTEVHAFLRAQARANADRGGFAFVRAGTGTEGPIQLPPGQLVEPGIRDLQYFTVYEARSLEPLRAVLGEEWCREGALRARGYLQRALPDQVLGHPVFDLLGVRYVLATRPLEHAGQRTGPRLKTERGEFFVYERPNAMPRAFTVPGLRYLDDDEALLAAMADPEIRFADAALVTPEVEMPDPEANDRGPPREVTFVRDEPSVVELDIGPGAHPWLVLTDTCFPGWSVSIDGTAGAMARCNYSQRLVRLPREGCRVRFEHSPPLLWPGMLLCLLGIGLMVFIRTSRGSSTSVETTE